MLVDGSSPLVAMELTLGSVPPLLRFTLSALNVVELALVLSTPLLGLLKLPLFSLVVPALDLLPPLLGYPLPSFGLVELALRCLLPLLGYLVSFLALLYGVELVTCGCLFPLLVAITFSFL